MDWNGGDGGSSGGESGRDGAELVVLVGELFETGFLLGFDVVELVEAHGVDVDGVAVVGTHGGCLFFSCWRFVVSYVLLWNKGYFPKCKLENRISLCSLCGYRSSRPGRKDPKTQNSLNKSNSILY